MKELKFVGPVFNEGWNLTVRRGTKWNEEDGQYVRIVLEDGTETSVLIGTEVIKFSDLTDEDLEFMHGDPDCTVEKLLAEMQEIYDGFSEDEDVTLVEFYL